MFYNSLQLYNLARDFGYNKYTLFMQSFNLICHILYVRTLDQLSQYHHGPCVRTANGSLPCVRAQDQLQSKLVKRLQDLRLQDL